MKVATVASIVISLCLSGAAQSRIQVDHIVPKLSHREYIVLDNTDDTISNRSRVEIPGVEVAKQFVATKFGYVDGKDFVVKNTYTSDNGVTHTYLKQLYKGKEIVNGDLNINVDKKGNVISYGNSFYNSKDASQSSLLPDNFGNSVDAFDALFKHIKVDSGVEKSKVVVKEGRSTDEPALLVNIPKVPKGVKADKKYIQTATGQLEPVWDLEADLNENWINGFVTSSNKVVGLHDWVHQASYNVIPIGTNDPEDGGRKVVTQQGSTTSSPLGWHDQGSGNKFTSTTGNNVIAFDYNKHTSDWTKAPRAQGGANLDFNFPIDFTKVPNTYVNAAITNVFYVSNMIHDIYYAHGFNEAAGNFQQNNFNKGGKGGDPVRAQAQDGSDKNNAFFATPPDGQQPVMRIHTFTVTNPNRDGDLDNGLITHEYTHGLSNRLTGGPANVNCLNTLQAGGMGEGWGDAMAYALRTRVNHTRNSDFGIANYVWGKTFRNYLYSTKTSVNPETYASFNKYTEFIGYIQYHNVGAVWAEILYEVYWNLIDQAGFSSDLLSGKHDHGNTLFIRLLINGMKLQPCNPSFIEARNAIIQAEKQLTNEKFKCAVWKGFAKRGLGTDAKFSRNKAIDDKAVPQGC